MCLPRNSFWPTEADLIDEILKRAEKRREDDSNSPKPKIADERPDPRYRPMAAMAYAANAKTGELSVGYSGSAGGMAAKGSIIQTDQSRRRHERLETLGYGPFSNTGSHERPYSNCAECAAVAIALSWGDDVGDLFLFPFNTDGQVMPLCQNCQTWVPKSAAGYCSEYNGKVQLNCRNDCGGPDGGGGEASYKRLKF